MECARLQRHEAAVRLESSLHTLRRVSSSFGHVLVGRWNVCGHTAGGGDAILTAPRSIGSLRQKSCRTKRQTRGELLMPSLKMHVPRTTWLAAGALALLATGLLAAPARAADQDYKGWFASI